MAWIDAETAARLVGSTVRIALFATLEFRSETVRLWGGSSATRVNGHVYMPVGVLGAVEGLDAPTDGTSRPFSLELSGILDGTPIFGAAVLAAAAADRAEVAGRPVSILARLFDEEWEPVGAVLPFKRGVMQRVRIVNTGGDEPRRTIGVECEDIFGERSRQAAGRFNDADQNHRFAGDRFFRFVSNQATRRTTWPDF